MISRKEKIINVLFQICTFSQSWLLSSSSITFVFVFSHSLVQKIAIFGEKIKIFFSNREDLGGACLGAFISSAFYPINVTKTHMQLVVGGPFLRMRSVFKQLLKERGLKGMFRGVHINYTRSFLSWGIVNVTYERLLEQLNRNW